MGSQTDLDQGGTSRQWVRTYMGPSVGWVYLPGTNPFDITAAGTYILQPDTSIVRVNIAGIVFITLPTAINPVVPAGVQPALFAKTAITILDIGAHAEAWPITIAPQAGENIMGLASIQITSNYGAYTFKPTSSQNGWVVIG